MKKFAVILAVLFVAFAFNAYAVSDNTGTHQGTGTFSCTIWNPLSVVSDAATGGNSLGTFVVNTTTPYTGAELTGDNTIAFTVTGEGAQQFYYEIIEDQSGSNADIVVDWTDGSSNVLTAHTTATGQIGQLTLGGTTPGTGTHVITATVSSLTAKVAGSESFTQTVKVGYNSF